MNSNDALTLAKDAARQAAARLGALLVKPIHVDSQIDRDIKLAADREADRLIIRALRDGSAYPVLSEESGWIGESRSDGTRWIVDPLDGSINFFRGIPFCGVSIGLWRNDEPLLGVIHHIQTGEVFSGIVGSGAWNGDVAVKVSSVDTASNAILCTGFPIATDFARSALIEYVEHVRNFKRTRLLGSAALSLAYVAAGRADAYYEREIKLWDVAAGLAIVKAAGGAIDYTAVDPAKQTLTVYASNGLLTRATV
jgi:myo-inositol-1(or 4)-monophosphatase